MTHVAVALAADRPRRPVHVDAAVGHLRGPIDLGAVATRRVHRHPVGRGIHHQVRVPVPDDVGAVVRRGAVLAHRDRHCLDDLAVAADGERLVAVVGGRDHLVADGELGGDVLLAEQPVAQVHTVGVDRDVDLGAGLPVLRRAPTDFAVAQPVEGALHRRIGRDGDRPLGSQPVRDVLVEAHRDGLTHADDLAVVGQHVRHGEVLG